MGDPTVSAPKINRERGGEKVRNNFAGIFDRQQKEYGNAGISVFPQTMSPDRLYRVSRGYKGCSGSRLRVRNYSLRNGSSVPEPPLSETTNRLRWSRMSCSMSSPLSILSMVAWMLSRWRDSTLKLMEVLTLEPGKRLACLVSGFFGNLEACGCAVFSNFEDMTPPFPALLRSVGLDSVQPLSISTMVGGKPVDIFTGLETGTENGI